MKIKTIIIYNKGYHIKINEKQRIDQTSLQIGGPYG